MDRQGRDVRFVPKADIDPNAASRKRALLRSVAARCCFNDDRAHHVGGPGTIIAVDVAIRARLSDAAILRFTRND